MHRDYKYYHMFGDEDKIRAFDAIAEKYYKCNFGTCSKSEMDVLMFSLYIEQILKKNNVDFTSYSDYSLSKQLGITQAQVSNLKVKKELKYPYDDFNWKKSFALVIKNAWYEDDSIKMHIPDKNLYIEIKNAIEENGGYVDVQLNKNLLKVPICCLLDLLIDIEAPVDRIKFVEMIKEKIKESNQIDEIINQKELKEILKDKMPDIVIDVFTSLIPVFGSQVGAMLKDFIGILKKQAVSANDRK